MKLAGKALLAAALGLAVAGPALAESSPADTASAQDDSSALFAGSGAAATENADAPAASVPASDFALGLAGSHEFGYRVPAYSKSAFDYADVMKSPYFSNELDLSVQDKDVKLVSNWELTARPLAADAATGEHGAWDKLVDAKPLEGYVSWSPASWKLSAGYQDFSWGVADKKNPTDNLNPRDYTVGVNADKIPVLAADIIWYPTDSISVEGVFVPSAQESKYPVDFKGMADEGAARLSAALSAALSAEYSALYHTPIAYAVTSGASAYEALELEPKNAIAGGKLSFRSPTLDCSASYLYDIDPLYTPVVTATATSATSSSVAIALERERIHRFGLDAKATVGKLGIWTEAAYSLTRNDGSSGDYEHRRSKLDYVLGADFNFGPNDAGYANLQYFGTWIPGYDDSFYEDLYAGKITDLAEAYRRALCESLGLDTEGLLQGATANVKWELADGAFTPQLTAVAAVPFDYDRKDSSDQDLRRYGSLALNPELEVKPVDSFHILLGADLAYSWIKVGSGDVKLDTATDKIGAYTPKNNVYLKLLYKWSYDLKK